MIFLSHKIINHHNMDAEINYIKIVFQSDCFTVIKSNLEELDLFMLRMTCKNFNDEIIINKENLILEKSIRYGIRFLNFCMLFKKDIIYNNILPYCTTLKNAKYCLNNVKEDKFYKFAVYGEIDLIKYYVCDKKFRKIIKFNVETFEYFINKGRILEAICAIFIFEIHYKITSQNAHKKLYIVALGQDLFFYLYYFTKNNIDFILKRDFSKIPLTVKYFAAKIFKCKSTRDDYKKKYKNDDATHHNLIRYFHFMFKYQISNKLINYHGMEDLQKSSFSQYCEHIENKYYVPDNVDDINCRMIKPIYEDITLLEYSVLLNHENYTFDTIDIKYVMENIHKIFDIPCQDHKQNIENSII